MFQKTVNLIGKIIEVVFPEPDIVRELEVLNGKEVLSRYKFYKKVGKIDAFLPYSNKFTQELIRELKYFGNDNAARICAEVLIEKIDFKDGEILVPIPLSKKRFKERGFNQCEKICEILVHTSHRNLKLSINNLFRIKNNRSQTKFKNDFDRSKNVRGIFKVKNCSKFFGKNLILIDDVVTSGATLNEAYKELEKCLPRSIRVFTIGH